MRDFGKITVTAGHASAGFCPPGVSRGASARALPSGWSACPSELLPCPTRGQVRCLPRPPPTEQGGHPRLALLSPRQGLYPQHPRGGTAAAALGTALPLAFRTNARFVLFFSQLTTGEAAEGWMRALAAAGLTKGALTGHGSSAGGCGEVFEGEEPAATQRRSRSIWKSRGTARPSPVAPHWCVHGES